jgi:hypothetical protein
MIQYGLEKDKYPTLADCEAALNSITPETEKRQKKLGILAVAIDVNEYQAPELADKLMERLIKSY